MVWRGTVDTLIDIPFRLCVSHEDDTKRSTAADVQLMAMCEVRHDASDPKVQSAALERGGMPAHEIWRHEGKGLLVGAEDGALSQK